MQPFPVKLLTISLSAPRAAVTQGEHRLTIRAATNRAMRYLQPLDDPRARVVEHSTQPAGFSPGVAARLLFADGQRLFVKALSSDPNPHSAELHRREAEVAEALPPEVPAPRLVWSYDDGDWVMLLFEDVEGRHPLFRG
ncbi:MAG: hypothetical protein ACRDI1_07710 [Actinomycetota bacterium]